MEKFEKEIAFQLLILRMADLLCITLHCFVILNLIVGVMFC